MRGFTYRASTIWQLFPTFGHLIFDHFRLYLKFCGSISSHYWKESWKFGIIRRPVLVKVWIERVQFPLSCKYFSYYSSSPFHHYLLCWQYNYCEIVTSCQVYLNCSTIFIIWMCQHHYWKTANLHSPCFSKLVHPGNMERKLKIIMLYPLKNSRLFG